MKGLLFLLTAQAIGQLIAKLLGVPVPGTVIGILVALTAMWLSPKLAAATHSGADSLLANFGLFLIPIGPTILLLPPALVDQGPKILAIIVISTLLTQAVSIAVFALLSKPPAVEMPKDTLGSSDGS